MKDQEQSYSKIGASNSNNLSTPKGGGAIKGLGETFTPNSFTGTGSYSISIPVTPARGFEPQLALSYNSGSGNGPFGLGFDVSLPKISIRTSLGVPKYDGTDIYLYGSAELVKKDKAAYQDSLGWNVTEYISRIEGGFSLITQHIDPDGKGSYWQVITAEHETHTFGKTQASQVFDLNERSKVFEWLIDQSMDAKGNKILYNYKAEDQTNAPTSRSNRSFNNRYIHSIQYGNFFSNGSEQFAFEVVFDYGEYDLDNLTKGGSDPYSPAQDWDFRSDAFSRYYSGFEIRTARLCRNILIFHTIQNELGDPCLVKRMSLEYTFSTNYQGVNITPPATLSNVQITGYRRLGQKAKDPYESKSLPAVTLGFSNFLTPEDPGFEELQMGGGINDYLHEVGFQPVDLNSEGITGLFYSSDGGAHYASPSGNGEYEKLKVLEGFPNTQNFHTGESALVDLDSNGVLDWVNHSETDAGYFKRTPEGNWQNFEPFQQFPTNYHSHRTEHADLSNDGKSDMLVVEQDQITVFESKGTNGFADPIQVPIPKGFPEVKVGYLAEHVGFADLMGDGMAHRIRVASGIVSCWPSMGYGQFGEQINLENAPDFGADFDASRLLITDIDGSGTSDLVYVQMDSIQVFINQNGNSFSDPVEIGLPEPYSDYDHIRFADILGNGTNCLVFTKMGMTPKHYFYNFIGSIEVDGSNQDSMKPYLLNTIDNGMGGFSQIQYCSSTKFYLEDKKAGRPWITKLPFPVQVVEQTTAIDRISNSRFSQRFKYHDGYYDPVERTFRGFGFVESWDTEDFESFNQATPDQNKVDKKYFVPPVYTKTWHHTGALFNGQNVSKQYEGEYFQGDSKAYAFPDSTIATEIYADQETLRQAYVALQGHIMRTEVYANDATLNPGLADNPYTVEQSNLSVQLHQPLGNETYASFMVLPSESIQYHYERNPEDPRVQQHFTLKTDGHGNVLQACSIFLPRRSVKGAVIYPQQQKLNASLERHQYVSSPAKSKDVAVFNPNLFFHVPYDSQSFELLNLSLERDYVTLEELQSQLKSLDLGSRQNIIPHGGKPGTGLQAQQLSWEKVFYWNSDQSDAAKLGQVSSPLLVHHHEHATFTNDWTVDIFGGRLIDQQAYTSQGYLQNVIYTKGGYFYDETNQYWWNKGEVLSYFNSQKPEAFFLHQQSENLFAKNTQGTQTPQDPSLCTKSSLAYDSYYLAQVNTTEYVGEPSNEIQLSTKAEIDYVLMHPYQVTDINENTSQVLFDPLGQVIATTLFGTENGKPVGGMTLYPTSSTQAAFQTAANPTFQDVIANPKKYLQGATSYFFYNLNAWQDSQHPASFVHLTRAQFNSEKTNPNLPYCQVAVGYSDGLGRELLSKVKTSSGMAYAVGSDGSITLTNGQPIEAQATDRWQVTERTLYNNKGHAYAQYLPYFSDSPLFENQESFNDGIPPTILHYDPLGRQIRVDTPKGFFSKVEFTPWEEQHFDENDTILDSDYYQNTNLSSLSIQEQHAITQAKAFYNTPHTKVYDNIGHPCFEIENNLGNVTADLFDDIKLSGGITQQDIFNALETAGYLKADADHQGYTWLMDKFQPYTKGFQLTLPNEFQSYLQKITDVLRQNSLTSIYTTDILGRVTQMIDPRLYYSNTSQGQSYYNFNYRYAMDGKKPTYTDSADAGTDMHLHNIFGQQLWSWSPRGYCQLIEYDRLQRKASVNTLCVTSEAVVTDYESFNRVEVFTYGESQPNATDENLNGQLYELKDLSGVITNSSFSIHDQLLSTSRQMVTDYQAPADWNKEVALGAEVYQTQSTYDALGMLINQTTPDGSVTNNGYLPSGQLSMVEVQFDDGTGQNIVTDIQYDAKGQRTSVQYGNGAKTYYTYEDTTLRLLTLKTTRKNSTGGIDTLQNLAYAYDPVGNITSINDSSIQTVFHANQKVAPICNYTYDAFYRLTKATGRQHISINANTYKNNQSDDSFMQSMFGPLPSSNDAGKLENYAENYTYDEAGNLIQKQHTAKSTSFTRELAVEDNCNRLKGLNYDDSGNLRALDINSTVDLSFNCCENLVRAATITRDVTDDADYYLYDSHEQRTRKVSVLTTQGGTSSQIEEKVYLGSYEIKRNFTGSIASDNCTFERQGLRVMDDQGCVAMIHYITTDTKTPANEKTRKFRFQLDNHLGSVGMELDEQAQLISYEEYFPYGGTALITGANQTEVQDKEYRYSGKERDDSTGLYYYGYRYYAPWLGRWLKPDPAGTIDGMNLYAFVGGNPAGHRDVDGRMDAESGDDNDDDVDLFLQGEDETLKEYLSKRKASDIKIIGEKAVKKITEGKPADPDEVRVVAIKMKKTTMGQGLHEGLPTNMAKAIHLKKERENLAQIQSGFRTTPALQVFYTDKYGVGGHTGTFVDPKKPTASQGTKGQSYAHDKLREVVKRNEDDYLKELTKQHLKITANGQQIMESKNITGLTPNLKGIGKLESPDANDVSNRIAFARELHSRREKMKRRARALSYTVSPSREPITRGGEYKKKVEGTKAKLPNFPNKYEMAHKAAWLSQPMRLKHG